MTNMNCEVFGKWILTGEHTVLRGGGALVFPLKGRSLKLKYKENTQLTSTQLTVSGEFGEEYKLLFWGVLEKALQMKKINHNQVLGHFHLDANLPIGSGLGASATLCVSIVNWMIAKNYLQNIEALEFARELENLFHGESSGVDVAVALYGKPIYFHRGQNPEVLKIENFFFGYTLVISYCGQRGMTLDCVQKVKKLFVEDPEKAKEIDLQMNLSERLAVQSFNSNSISELIQSIGLARECFNNWGLVEGKLSEHILKLIQMGALTCKPTGSGGGGYVLSLWETDRFKKLKSDIVFIPCF